MANERRPRVVATIEARMAATRLPGKVLLPLGGRPMLERMIERLHRCRSVDEVVVASTEAAPDEAIEDLCRDLGVRIHRGSVENIAERLLGAASMAEADILVQTTGDCPLIDPAVIDDLIDLYFRSEVDFVCNHLPQSFPLGLDARVFPIAALRRVMQLTDDPVDLVHGSSYIYQHPEHFRIANLSAPAEMNRPHYRITVDEPRDYRLVARIFDALWSSKPHFTAADIISLLDAHPELVAINAEVRQKRIEEG